MNIENNLNLKFTDRVASFQSKFSECRNIVINGTCLSASVLKNNYLENFSKNILEITKRQPISLQDVADIGQGPEYLKSFEKIFKKDD